VGLAVYNGENFLADALRSLVEQDYRDMEILIGDNASTDDTLAICERFAALDDRIRIVHSDVNRGLSWNHNRLLPEARGEYFKWAAHDDRYLPTFVSSCVDVLDRHPDVVLCYTNTIDIDGDDQFMKAWPATNRASSNRPLDRFRDVLMNERQCFPIYGVMRTEILRSTVLMGNYAGSDHPLLAELALRGRFVEIPAALFEHREHAERSITAYPNPRDRVVLYRPTEAGKVTFPRWSMAFGYVKVIARSSLTLGSKARALISLGPWAKMWWRPLVLGIPGGVRYALRRRRDARRADRPERAK
jgi:glycosyltransferase involved in cell wall biosynthesis